MKFPSRKKQQNTQPAGIGAGVGVNLMPREMRLRAAMRKAQIQGGAMIVVAVGILIVAFAWGIVGKTAAEVELGDAQRKLVAVEAERRQYQDVPGVYAAIAAARAEIATAMGEEILFSTMLSNLARIVPAPSTLNTVNYTLAGSEGKTKDAPKAGQPATFGTASFGGETTSMSAVAAVLDAISAAPEYTDVQLASAQRGDGEKAGLVQFTISAKLTDKALSGRFQNDQASGNPSANPSPGSQPSGGGS